MGSTTETRDSELREQIEVIGDNPRYLWKLFFICMLPVIVNGLNAINYVFLTEIPEHWCSVDDLEAAGWSTNDIRLLTTPQHLSNTSTCIMRNLDYSKLAKMSFEEAIVSVESVETDNIPCAKRYLSKNTPSMVYDFDLVCERTALKSIIQVGISFGKFFGSFIFGMVSDRFGRRKSFLCGSILYVICSPLIALANSYVLIIIGRIGIGAAGSALYASSFIILSEIASKRKRGGLGILYNMSYPIGIMIVPGIAYFIRDWRTLQLIISVPAFAIIIFYWLIPESPMWLLSNNREEEVVKFLNQQLTKLNLPILSPQSFKNDKKVCHTNNKSLYEKVKGGFQMVLGLFLQSELRNRLLIMLLLWSIFNFAYYGLALNVDNFGVNRYLYGFLTGLVEAPSYILPIPLLRITGRKLSSIVLFYIAGFSLLGILLLPETDGLNVPLLIVASIGRLCVSAVSAIVVLHCTELFPTLKRNTAVGLSSTASHIGSMIAPVFVVLIRTDLPWVPSAVFGLLTIFAGTLIFFLPETKNKPLPNTTQDVIEGPKNSKCGFHQFCLY